MRQKDITRLASILDNEMRWADDMEIDGLKVAIGAIMADVGWAQPELDMTPLVRALQVTPEIRWGRCAICGHDSDHDGVPHGEATGDGRLRTDNGSVAGPPLPWDSHIVRSIN
jgi:hypothetical protein